MIATSNSIGLNMSLHVSIFTYFIVIQFNSIVYFRHTIGPYHIIICHNTIEKCKSNI